MFGIAVFKAIRIRNDAEVAPAGFNVKEPALPHPWCP